MARRRKPTPELLTKRTSVILFVVSALVIVGAFAALVYMNK